MASELDIFINRTFTDLLGSRGFKKSGRTYRLTSPSGNQVLFNIRSVARQGPVKHFAIIIAIAPAIMLDYYHTFLDLPLDRSLGVSDWFASANMIAPANRHSRFATTEWAFEGEEEAIELSNEIRRQLDNGLLDYTISLLDRGALLELIRTAPDTWRLMWVTSKGSSGEILLLVEDGPSGALDDALNRAKAEGNERIVDWATSYLGRHSA